MKPDLEWVEVRQDESFTVWAHGYPYRTVRWHFHPEYEIQLITTISGKFFVGDYIGDFQPGNLVMMGPNLPHNWVSDLPDGRPVAERCLVLQFSEEFIKGAIGAFAELRFVEKLLDEARAGTLFQAHTGAAAQPIMRALLQAQGAERVRLFLALLELLVHDSSRQPLARGGYEPDPSSYMSAAINHVVAYIGANLGSELNEAELAALAGQSPSAFSRSFRKHTGQSFVQFVARLRINLACELLMSDALSVTEICFKVGFNNVSNFNRQFLAQKNMPPSKFRGYHRLNAVNLATA